MCMSINHIFYKNNLIAEIEKQASMLRQQLLNELVASGSDAVVWKRRFRMLRHQSTLQAQLINKIYNFETNDPADYLELKNLNMDLILTIYRNA